MKESHRIYSPWLKDMHILVKNVLSTAELFLLLDTALHRAVFVFKSYVLCCMFCHWRIKFTRSLGLCMTNSTKRDTQRLMHYHSSVPKEVISLKSKKFKFKGNKIKV